MAGRASVPGSALGLLAAAQNEGGQLQALADIECAGAFGAVDLVAADAHEIHAQFSGTTRDLQKSLDRIGVEQGGGAGLPQAGRQWRQCP